MDISLEALIVGAFVILPGFLSAAMRLAIAPGQRASTGEWVAGGIITSLVLNAVAIVAFTSGAPLVDLSQPVSALGEALGQLPGHFVGLYLGVLYTLALVWGLASGLLAEHAPHALAHRLRLTPVSPARNVFNDVMADLVRTRANSKLTGMPEQQVAWLRIERTDQAILGRLAFGSVDFAVDAPVEVFLRPAFRTHAGQPLQWQLLTGTQHRGVYLRLLPTDAVEVFTARADWSPGLAAPPSPVPE